MGKGGRKPYIRRPQASINAWPGGPRTEDCLSCERPFLSLGKEDRRCTKCEHNEETQEKKSIQNRARRR